MADKLRAYVMEEADRGSIANAENAALVSAVFAREMECVAGKPVRYDSGNGQSDGGQLGVMELSEWKRIVESWVLNPEVPVSLSASQYDSILGWALSGRDMAELKAIRARGDYWEEFSAATFED
jgi:hypothetical protein